LYIWNIIRGEKRNVRKLVLNRPRSLRRWLWCRLDCQAKAPTCQPLQVSFHLANSSVEDFDPWRNTLQVHAHITKQPWGGSGTHEFVFYSSLSIHLGTTIPVITSLSRPRKKDKLEVKTINCPRKSYLCI
jgi:hypothetical protein